MTLLAVDVFNDRGVFPAFYLRYFKSESHSESSCGYLKLYQINH